MKKKIFDQDVGLLETFLESVPSTYIITVIYILSIYSENMKDIWYESSTWYNLLQEVIVWRT